MPEVDSGQEKIWEARGGPCVSQMEWRVLWTRGEVSMKVSNLGDGMMPVAMGGCSTH